jgi:putative ABC transport system permease protein
LKLTQNAVKNVLESEIQNAVYSFKLVEASGLVSRVRVDTNGISSYEVVAEIMMGASVLVLMASVFSMTSNERNRQLGLLRSLGATKGFIFRNALLEAGLMALVGGVFGLIVGNLVVMFGETFLVATFNIHLIQPTFLEALTLSVTSVALGILVGTAASTLPAYRVSSGDPYDAIRKGE